MVTVCADRKQCNVDFHSQKQPIELTIFVFFVTPIFRLGVEKKNLRANDLDLKIRNLFNRIVHLKHLALKEILRKLYERDDEVS